MVFLLFTVQTYYSLLIKLFILVLYSNNINQLVLLYTHNNFGQLVNLRLNRVTRLQFEAFYDNFIL